MNEIKDLAGREAARIETQADDQGTKPKLCIMCGENGIAFNENELCEDCNQEMWNKNRD